MAYKPKPLDTSDVELDNEVDQLVEELAKNTHENWSKNRLKDGWTLGEKRDDQKKTTPCLIPYEELPESEKEYDRVTATETIKFIVKRGFTLIKGSKNQDSKSTYELQRLKNEISSATALPSLTRLWNQRERSLWREDSEIYLLMAKKFLKMGEPLYSYDVLAEATSLDSNPVLRQQLGLSLSRLGLHNQALETFQKLIQDGVEDEETIGMMGRVYKALWLESECPEQIEEYLKQANLYYEKAYHLSRGVYSGINYATMQMAIGEDTNASKIADDVIELCLEDEQDYWNMASLGEAYLIKKNLKKSKEWYKKACLSNPNAFGEIGSTKRNAQILCWALNLPNSQTKDLFESFVMPDVVLFTGHRLGRFAGNQQLLSSNQLTSVKKNIKKWIEKKGKIISFSSAACGSDLLFLDLAHELENTTNVIIPGDLEKFITQSVKIDGDLSWEQKFKELALKKSEIIELGGEGNDIFEIDYEYANLVIFGLAKIKAKQLGANLSGLAVSNKASANIESGTKSAIEMWKEHGLNPDLIDVSLKNSQPSSSESKKEKPHKNEIVAILFADTVNFSKLANQHFPLFNEKFWGLAKTVLKEFEKDLLFTNTWGDALYGVFSNFQAAGEFALKWADKIKNTDWIQEGFPTNLSIRIALHAGPVFQSVNPIDSKINFVGTHVCRAARIEPMTPPSAVFASQEFAAIASAREINSFSCDYVGKMPMAKNYGVFPTYLVKKRGKNVP